ncbi:hypothetical protein ENTB43_265 [Enterobacter phage Entb_43]|nr:hypothetical protein ENTB43_265 [Enterobacter phage Entb_43]
MHYGYALITKDKDGFEIPFYEAWDGNPVGLCFIFTNKISAEKYMGTQLGKLQHLLENGRQVETQVTKWLFFKRDIIEHIPLTEQERRNVQQMINTLQVKKVKVA